MNTPRTGKLSGEKILKPGKKSAGLLEENGYNKPVPKIADTQMGICYFYWLWSGIRTDLYARLRGSLARFRLDGAQPGLSRIPHPVLMMQIPIWVSAFLFVVMGGI